ncbi:MAG: nuclear transport factor 2 family protein [Planctomycetes bacterium]|nr:nuclear transport factor 2 family protein [Planctomycetota bacterium]
MMKTTLLGFAVVVAGVGFVAAAGPDEQHAAIKRAALDYAEGWYEANPEKMERALHADLAKRVVRVDPRTKREKLEHMSALTLIQYTRRRADRPKPEKQQKDVTILDVYGNTACVKLVMNGWIDYLHVARIAGQWKIVNVLWELKPENK